MRRPASGSGSVVEVAADAERFVRRIGTGASPGQRTDAWSWRCDAERDRPKDADAEENPVERTRASAEPVAGAHRRTSSRSALSRKEK
jgi:hypothetical protein